MGLLNKVLDGIEVSSTSQAFIDDLPEAYIDKNGSKVKFRCTDGKYRSLGHATGYPVLDLIPLGYLPVHLRDLPKMDDIDLIGEVVIGMNTGNNRIIIGRVTEIIDDEETVVLDGHYDNNLGPRWYVEIDNIRDASGLTG